MRHMIFISNSTEKFHKLKNYFAITKEWQLFMATDLKDITNLLFSSSADSVLIDLEFPVDDLSKIISTLSEQFSYLYRIALRGDKFSARQRGFIENSHSSFKSPKNLSEMRIFLNRVEAFFPVVPKYDSKSLNRNSRHLEYEVAELYRLVNLESTTINDLITIVQSNRKIAKAMIKRVNSSFYGLESQVSIPTRALKLLGLNGIKEVLQDNFPSICSLNLVVS